MSHRATRPTHRVESGGRSRDGNLIRVTFIYFMDFNTTWRIRNSWLFWARCGVKERRLTRFAWSI